MPELPLPFGHPRIIREAGFEPANTSIGTKTEFAAQPNYSNL